MKKKEFVKRYGQEGYDKHLKQKIEWKKQNPEIVKRLANEQNRKGGIYYEYKLEYDRTGLRGERNRIRVKHANQYGQYKKIVAPESQIHHQWIWGTSNYTGVALVEKDQHMHGYIDVIQILDGEITLFAEKDLMREQNENKNIENCIECGKTLDTIGIKEPLCQIVQRLLILQPLSNNGVMKKNDKR